uniref:VWFA domain-containing protein n=1 Tax=Phasianus colchicus TaxID=9054 RepID=A0A669PLQ2_PHACC
MGSMGLCVSLWVCVGCCWSLWDAMGHYGSLWGAVNHSEALWDVMGALCSTMGLSGVLWGSMEYCGSLWISTGCYGVQACGPMAQRMCGENAEVPGFCFLLFSRRSLPTTPRACPTSASDIVFLMDGSGSVAGFDFQRMKIFVIEIIRRFRGTNTRFAVVQFSTGVQLHVGFSDFDRLSARDLERQVEEVEQSNGITQTATAIRTVLTRVFAGSRAGANKVLIVVTDGQKYGDALQYGDVIPEAERAGVVRYAIGVGSAFKDAKAAAELQTIASAPPEAHVFRVDNFEALQGIQEQLQEKIFAIEGTRPAFGSSFQLEMAQEGFSTLLTPEGAVLGAVGAYDWAGGVFIYGADGKVAFVNASEADGGVSDAYLGYATESLSLGGLRALVLGAPRYRHVGRLLLFVLHRGGKWELRSDAMGRQVGSYFGAALCALEGSGDGVALLVGVPMFYGDGTGGRVEVCTVLPQGPVLRCHQMLRGQAGHPLGRFGASVARLGDIDGDGLHDVAVGAPMEDDERGAIYIFRGEKGGVSDHYSQRIAGSIFHSAPQHFGQALSGGRDMTGDRLPDVAVGAQGQVLLLRWESPPLLKVEVTVTFSPPEIPTSALDCHRAEEEEPSAAGAAAVATAEVCFVGTKKSRDSLGMDIWDGHWDGWRHRMDVKVGLETWDAWRDRMEVWGMEGWDGGLGDGAEQMQLGRALGGWDGGPCAGPQLPFEKNCGEDNQCVPDLRVALSFSGLEELVVGITEDVTITVTVHNVGEDAYGAHVELRHPKALSYRKATALQVPTGSGGTAAPQGLPHIPPDPPDALWTPKIPSRMFSRPHRCHYGTQNFIQMPSRSSHPLQMSPRPQISSSSYRILHIPTPQTHFRCPQEYRPHLADPNPIQRPSKPLISPDALKTTENPMCPQNTKPQSDDPKPPFPHPQTPPQVPPHPPPTHPPHS